VAGGRSRCLWLALLALGLAGAPAASAQAATRYVDCSAHRAGDGSLARPFESLARASAIRLTPGSRLLQRRGTSCTGRLAPQGSGSARRPALIGADGRGAAPHVEGAAEDAVLLRDTSWVTLRSLEVTNRGPGEARRRGVHVVATGGVVRGVTVRDLWIHDVQGDLSKDAGGSGGIQVDVLGPEPTRFDDLLIARNRIADVSRSGIFIVGTADSDRPRANQPWPAASTRVRVRANRLKRIGGDGIVPLGTVGAVVEDNVVSDGNLRGRPLNDPQGMICNAGIWTFHANNTLIRFNDVYRMNINGCDDTGYDIDYDQDGTVVEFNLSHDNEGGFTLLCTDTGPRRADVRFNLSVNDGHTFQESPCKGAAGAGATLDGVRMYNNTFVAPVHNVFSPALVSLPALFKAGDFEFRNNIVVATQSQLLPLPCGDNCSHNLFFGLPASGTDAVTQRPRFEDAGGDGRGRIGIGRDYRLSSGSPAIGAGIAIPSSGNRDYFGNRISRPPSIGFQQPG
jgi:hypothetical protein